MAEPEHAVDLSVGEDRNGRLAMPAPAKAASDGTVPGALPPHSRLDRVEIAASLLAFVAWVFLVTAGITVGTQDYIDPIRKHLASSLAEVVGCLVVIALCHTVTNTAMLCCVSAFLGVLGFRAVGAVDPAAPAAPLGRRDAYIAAVTRGFFIFLIIQSGSVILSDQAFTNLSLEKYIRLAGLSSLLSFTVGYNPAVFGQLMDRVNRNFTTGSASR
ncbi:hypothetical protein [Paludisphaera mucosa]|uniref:Uncharacterized protein n=1 Tax=Paludisphaera mucosa TaxID=3030827 RepID=A0ABT6FI94_9BACT|nr:hypothetical protein [Paludisphaera mucosa]MDG3007262.1 hypothetical protein [Paludisphaera mucosa]